MALSAFMTFKAEIQLRDGAGRDTSMTLYVPETEAVAYIGDPTTGAIRDWIDASQAMTGCELISEGLRIGRKELAPTNGTGLRGNKAVISAVADNGANVTVTIPSYVSANLPLESNGLDIDVDAVTPTAWATWKTATVSLGITNQGSPISDFVKGKLND